MGRVAETDQCKIPRLHMPDKDKLVSYVIGTGAQP